MERKRKILGIKTSLFVAGGLILAGSNPVEARPQDGVNKGIDNRPSVGKMVEEENLGGGEIKNEPLTASECSNFYQIWIEYLDVQANSEIVKGKVVDFSEFNPRMDSDGNSQPPGFDQRDPEFHQQFHGHVEGFEEILTIGGWVYCPIDN